MDKNTAFITPKELYELAVKNGVENQPINIEYVCNDDWYNYEGNLKKNDTTVDVSGVSIQIYT